MFDYSTLRLQVVNWSVMYLYINIPWVVWVLSVCDVAVLSSWSRRTIYVSVSFWALAFRNRAAQTVVLWSHKSHDHAVFVIRIVTLYVIILGLGDWSSKRYDGAAIGSTVLSAVFGNMLPGGENLLICCTQCIHTLSAYPPSRPFPFSGPTPQNQLGDLGERCDLPQLFHTLFIVFRVKNSQFFSDNVLFLSLPSLYSSGWKFLPCTRFCPRAFLIRSLRHLVCLWTPVTLNKFKNKLSRTVRRTSISKYGDATDIALTQ